MKTALTLNNPTPEELAGLRAALNFPSGFAVRRAQILLQVAAGKTASADLIVIDRDILLCPLHDLPTTKVAYTVVNGKIVYEV